MLPGILGSLITLAMAQEPPVTVALVFADHTEIVTVIEAQREYRQLDALKTHTEEQAKRFAALNLALGTVFDLKRVRKDWEATGNKWEGPI